MKPLPAALLALGLFAATPGFPANLHLTRSSPSDLALTGRITGVPEGKTRYVSWSDLRALPVTRLKVEGEFVAGPQTLTVLFLDDLWKALSAGPEADTILATCDDGYASVFTTGFIRKYRPFLVLEIDGKGPGDWPPPGLAFNPGPYAIGVSSVLVPEAAGFPDLEHKKPWAVTTLEFAAYADRFRGAYTGKWTSLSLEAQRGRETWINSCASCHQGPAGIFGGSKSGKPFPVVAAYAGYDRSYFMRYVRDPQSLVPSAKMEAHPRYTDAQLSDLIAFITAGSG